MVLGRKVLGCKVLVGGEIVGRRGGEWGLREEGGRERRVLVVGGMVWGRGDGR